MNNKIYKLTEVAGSLIAADLKDKSGVYQWINTVNGKSYVGSSSNLSRRFLEYLNPNRLDRELKRGESIIYKALLKYGYLSFYFKILEVIELDDNIAHSYQIRSLNFLEQKYIDTIKPEYNILSIAGSNRGHKLSIETKVKMSKAKKGIISPRKGSNHSIESRLLQNSGRKVQVYVYNPEWILLNSYNSITECSKETKFNYLVIWRAIISKKLVNNKYYFSNSILN
uniref:GIY-YIG domain-containing protein n=1 Tax=Cantharellus lutescens TaxID=104198 RepID=A0A2S0S4E8_9AGAM|nr:hypothetical protein [Cantharellus lutescens]AWA82216.1 hypothetical protein [Cantharellus lutescens]